MATFRLRRTDYGSTLRDPTIPVGFLFRGTGDDPTITVSIPSPIETDVKLSSSGDGKVKLT
jgi:hypothetical protein